MTAPLSAAVPFRQLGQVGLAALRPANLIRLDDVRVAYPQAAEACTQIHLPVLLDHPTPGDELVDELQPDPLLRP